MIVNGNERQSIVRHRQTTKRQMIKGSKILGFQGEGHMEWG
jgi:hypothetical protein